MKTGAREKERTSSLNTGTWKTETLINNKMKLLLRTNRRLKQAVTKQIKAGHLCQKNLKCIPSTARFLLESEMRCDLVV